MNTDYSNRRKNYYVKEDFQRNFIIKFCLLVIIGTVISGALVYFMSQNTVTTVFENSRLKIKSTADFILPAVFLSSAVVIVLVGFATIVVTLYASHKIAGPLYRIEKDLEKVASGDFEVKFNLRKNDQLQALATRIDRVIAMLGQQMQEVKQLVSDLESDVEALQKGGEKVNFQEMSSKLKNIHKNLSKFNV